MCNRQVGIIISCTAAILLLLVTTAALVFHYLYSQKTENIPITKMHFLSELPQYNDIDFTNCKCQHSEENCEKEIENHISLQIQREEICTKDKILCCNLKNISHWDKIVYNDKEKNNSKDDGGEENASVEEDKMTKGLEGSPDELTLSKYLDSSHCKCQSLEVECDKEIHIPQLSSLEMVSYCPHPNILCCNNEDDPNIEKETSQHYYEKNVTDMHEEKNMLVPSGLDENNKLNITNLNSDSKSNLSLDKFLIKSNEGDESISTNFILDTLQIFKEEVNTSELSTETKQPTMDIIANLPEINFKKSETTKNDLLKDKNYSNNKGKKSSFTEANPQEIENLIIKNKGQGSELCSGDECRQNDQEENKSVHIISGVNNTDEAITDKTNVSLLNEFNLHDIMEVLNIINLTSSESEKSNTTSNTLDSLESSNDGSISLYDMMEDLNMFDLTRSLSQLNNSNSPTETLYPSVNADKSVLNLVSVDQSSLSSLDEINLYGMNDDFSFPMPEQDNYNSTSVTFYSKSSNFFTDYIFYYSYLVVFLYVISFAIAFLVPVFSIPGLVTMVLVYFGFPHIIQSQVLDITSPVLKFVFGLL